MGGATKLEPRVRRRVGVGLVEIVPEHVEDRSLRTLKDNLHNRVCALLVAIVVAAQVADVVTTYRALAGNLYIENNPVLRALIVRSPPAAYAVKMLIIFGMVLVVLSRLRGRRARIALAVAAAISLIAPLMNFALLVRA
jgi:hypothetical protein